MEGCGLVALSGWYGGGVWSSGIIRVVWWHYQGGMVEGCGLVALSGWGNKLWLCEELM